MVKSVWLAIAIVIGSLIIWAITNPLLASGKIEIPSISSNLLWTTDRIDTHVSYSTPGNTSIAVDDSGQIHVTYVTNRQLRYAVLSNTVWITQVIDPDASVLVNSLAVDKAGVPHVAYVDLYPQASTGYLRYVVLSGTIWLTQTVEDNPNVESYNVCGVSLALDKNGSPRIGYGTYGMPLSVRYAALTASGWEIQPVNSTVYGTICVALDLDANDLPHIAYSNLDTHTYTDVLYHAVLSGTTWVSHTIGTGRPSTLRVDRQQISHVLYADGSSLKYAVLSDTVWLNQGIPSPVPIDQNFRGFMDFGADDRPHVSFAGQYGQTLYYATLTNTAWLVQAVDAALLAGRANSIAVDQQNHVSISYLNTYLNQVRVAQGAYPVSVVFLPAIQK
jgi:hypothetical protein